MVEEGGGEQDRDEEQQEGVVVREDRVGRAPDEEHPEDDRGGRRVAGERGEGAGARGQPGGKGGERHDPGATRPGFSGCALLPFRDHVRRRMIAQAEHKGGFARSSWGSITRYPPSWYASRRSSRACASILRLEPPKIDRQSRWFACKVRSAGTCAGTTKPPEPPAPTARWKKMIARRRH
jgi:hypothetical protein